MLPPLVPLFEAQACCEAVKLIPGIQHYACGGQPWHFGMEGKDHLDQVIYHLGFRQFPQRQITLQTALDVPFQIDIKKLAERSLTVPDRQDRPERCVLHGTFTAPGAGVPAFWKFLASIRLELAQLFSEIVFVGSKREQERAGQLYPAWTTYDDNRNFLDLAKFVDGSGLVIGSGSCVVALAGLLGVPTIRIHDPIGDAPKVIWSNLGDNQRNETLIGIRSEWPRFRDTYIKARAETAAPA